VVRPVGGRTLGHRCLGGRVDRPRPGAVGIGLRLALRGVPLAAATAAALLVSQGLWRNIHWVPASLPPNWAEPLFVGTKLAVLYALAALIVAGVLRVYGTRLRTSTTSTR
jgi:hypothetical protein